MVYEGRAAPSFLEQCAPDDPVLVVNSFSKSWAMTGWRVGWVTHPPALGELLGNMIEFNYSCVPPFVMRAADVAIRDGEPFVAQMVAYCRTGRDIVSQHLPDLPHVADYRAPEASFYAFFRVEGTEARTLAFAQDLVRTAKVGIAPGTAFGPGAEGWYRLCFAQKPETIAEAMGRLEGALKQM
jgi:aspartate/methionine/tyrosine aminotransferase